MGTALVAAISQMFMMYMAYKLSETGMEQVWGTPEEKKLKLQQKFELKKQARETEALTAKEARDKAESESLRGDNARMKAKQEYAAALDSSLADQNATLNMAFAPQQENNSSANYLQALGQFNTPGGWLARRMASDQSQS